MIHVATVHYRSDQWIDVQTTFLRRYLRHPYQIWANLEGVEQHAAQFDHVVPALGRHEYKLNLIAAEISAVSSPDDLIMFLDGDAFPIADPMPTVLQALSHHHLVAVQRPENDQDPQPHPCFAVTTVRNWMEIGGDWCPGHPWEPARSGARPVTDVGGNLLRLLELHHRTWLPLQRTNRLNLHPVWYGVYGGIVYHHGAGFRPALSRHDWLSQPRLLPQELRTLPIIGLSARTYDFVRLRYWARSTSRREATRSAHIYQDIKANPRFFERFL